MYGQRRSLPTAAAGLFLVLLLSFTALTGCRDGQPTTAGENGFLVIRGAAVEDQVRLSMDEVKALEGGLVEDDYFSVNSYGTKQYFHFKGVWVWHLLKEKANLKEHASRVSFIAGDGYTVEYTLEEVKRDDYIDEQNPEAQYKMILAWEEDGWEYNPGEGNPLKLVVGQREPGDVNKPYWVRNVKTIRID